MEWSGRGFVGLSAKTYFCFGPDDQQKEKCSAKGINKSAKLTYEHFRINIVVVENLSKYEISL